MPRSARVQFIDGVYHVTNRGLERRNIVSDDDDRRIWLHLLEEAAVRCRWRVFAYVLMDNHFHLFLRTPLPNLSDGMHDFESAYVSVFNRRHGRTGPLFQGRFKTVAVEQDGHAWEVSRYVHLNPVRAGLVRDAAKYVWSSYRFYLDPQGAPSWLDWRTVLLEIARTESAARIAYRRFVESGVKQPPANPLADLVDGWILGGGKFTEECRKQAEVFSGDSLRLPELTFDDIAVAVAAVFEVDVVQLAVGGRHRHLARDAAILLVRELTSASLESTAARFGNVTRSAVVEAVRRAQKHRDIDPLFRVYLERVRGELGR